VKTLKVKTLSIRKSSGEQKKSEKKFSSRKTRTGGRERVITTASIARMEKLVGHYRQKAAFQKNEVL